VQRGYARTILAADHYPDIHPDVAMPNHELLEIHRSKISLHHAKADYTYPTIRLPHTFSALAGLSTQIFQTVHKGALAFLVVVSPPNKAAEKSADISENIIKNAKSPVLTWRRSPVRIRPSPSFFFQSEENFVSDDKKEELATSEELPTSAEGDETRKEEQADDYVVDLGGSYVHYHRGLDGKLHSREYLAEDLIDEDVSDEDLRRDVKDFKAIDIDAIRAIQDSDKGIRALKPRDVYSQPLKSPKVDSNTDAQPTLHFSQSDLERFVEHRKARVSPRSVDWITRSARDVWESLGGQLAPNTGPAVCSWGPGRLDVFVIGTDNNIWHRAWDGSRWTGWGSLGDAMASSPAATSRSANSMDVFVLRSDNNLWQRPYNQGWGAWTAIGGLP